MGSPKHLWSGDWREESAAAAAKRRGETGQTAEPVRADDVPPPRPARKPISRHFPKARPRRRVRVSKQEMRHWAVAGGVALVVAFISASVVTLLARGDSQPSSRASGGAWMGVEMRSRSTGEAVIDAVVPGSPADVGGLRPGDVMLGIDNTSVTSTADVTAALSRLRPGEVVAVSASRGTAGFTAQVTLAARPRGYAMP